MTPVVRKLIENAIAGAEDNLYRFQMAVRNTAALDKQWGESGKTLREWIASAEKEVADLKKELES